MMLEAALQAYDESMKRDEVLQQLDTGVIDINRWHGRHESVFMSPWDT